MSMTNKSRMVSVCLSKQKCKKNKYLTLGYYSKKRENIRIIFIE